MKLEYLGQYKGKDYKPSLKELNKDWNDLLDKVDKEIASRMNQAKSKGLRITGKVLRLIDKAIMDEYLSKGATKTALFSGAFDLSMESLKIMMSNPKQSFPLMLNLGVDLAKGVLKGIDPRVLGKTIREVAEGKSGTRFDVGDAGIKGAFGKAVNLAVGSSYVALRQADKALTTAMDTVVTFRALQEWLQEVGQKGNVRPEVIKAMLEEVKKGNLDAIPASFLQKIQAYKKAYTDKMLLRNKAKNITFKDKSYFNRAGEALRAVGDLTEKATGLKSPMAFTNTGSNMISRVVDNSVLNLFGTHTLTPLAKRDIIYGTTAMGVIGTVMNTEFFESDPNKANANIKAKKSGVPQVVKTRIGNIEKKYGGVPFAVMSVYATIAEGMREAVINNLSLIHISEPTRPY